MTHLLAGSTVTAITPHDPKRQVKGGQFKGGADLYAASGSPVIMPTFGKVAHVHPNKTLCGGALPRGVKPPGCQIAISEEIIVRGDRRLTGNRLFLARFEPVPGLSFDPLKHIEEGTVIGHLVDFLHIASNRPPWLAQLLGAA